MVWGVVGDMFGRKKLIVGAFLVDFMCNFALSFVNVFWLFFFLKFVTGLIIAAPNALFFTYVAETHSNANRAQAIMHIGFAFGFAGVIQPVIAYLVLPLDIPEFASWRVFLIICAMPSLLSALVCMMFPESPTFLFSKGKHEEGMQVLKRIFALNTGGKQSAYPIVSVSPEKIYNSGSEKQKDRNIGWMGQFKVLFVRPYITRLLLLVTMQVLIMLCVNSVRLWTPQLFAFLDQYETMPLEKNTKNITTVCDMISFTLAEKPPFHTQEAKCQFVSGEVYLRTLVIGAVNTFCFLFAGPFMRCIGQRNLVFTFLPAAAALCIALNWVDSSDLLMGILSVYTPLTAIALNAIGVMQVDAFPTQVRALAISIILIFGRIASLSGNLILPVVLNVSCQIVFMYLAGCLAVCFLLTWMIPRTQEEN